MRRLDEQLTGFAVGATVHSRQGIMLATFRCGDLAGGPGFGRCGGLEHQHVGAQ
jgi:hypothetical protein